MEVLKIVTSVSFLFSIIRMTTPILYASLSYLIADLVGVANIGIEGIMLTCALAGVLASAALGGNAFFGLCVAIIIGGFLGILLCFIVTKLKTDATISGIAFNIAATGGTVFVLYLVVGEKGISSSMVSGMLPTVSIPALRQVPLVGNILLGHNILTYIAMILVILMSLFLRKTSLGLHIRSCGENPEALKSVGVRVSKVQYIALAMSGILAAMGGAYMSMGYVSYFIRDMVAGRGFIAIAAASLGGKKPGFTLLVCVLFGIADAFAVNPETQNIGIPTELVSTIPYIVTIVVLVIYSYKKMLDKKKIAVA